MSDPETKPVQQAQPAVEVASPEHRERRRQKLTAFGFFLFFIVLWMLIHGLNWALTHKVSPDTAQSRRIVVDIPHGSSVSDIAGKLAAQNIISSPILFELTSVGRGSFRKLKAGEYRFDGPMSLLEALTRLERGHMVLHRFTVPEGYTVKEIARALGNRDLADENEFLELANDPEFCKEMGFGDSGLEGFLFPDTYRIPTGLPTKRVIRMMVDRFRDACDEEIDDDILNSGPALRDVVTVASIIEKEALHDDEEPLIASVIYNRLHRNMPLQCDVTIRYPLDNYGVELTREDLQIDSPYNSYELRGLPPTPICNPGIAAIKAALKPADTKYLYFVSMNNGWHKFSASLREHNEAVLRYQVLDERG
ncbi:endolytic transglycosylase MltG [Candidatus Poribacteria bacterium]|nr:endolytic transglycosylase MltG [Candidatus Poribacteria bacterium]